MSKRLRKANFSESEVAKLLEEVSFEKTLLMSSFQTSVTNKQKCLVWEKITRAVNAVGGNGRDVKEVRKKWKDLKNAAINKPHIMSGTGGGGKTPDVPYEDLIMSIIGQETHLRTGIPGTTLADTWRCTNEDALNEGDELVPVIDDPTSDMIFPEGTTAQPISIVMDEDSLGLEGCSSRLLDQSIVVSAPSTSTPNTQNNSQIQSSTPLQFSAVQSSTSIFKSTSTKTSKNVFPPRKASTPSCSSSASLPPRQPAQDKDEVWFRWMESEIKKNELKEKLLKEQLEVVEEQKALMRLQKENLRLKIKGHEQRLKEDDTSLRSFE